MFTNAIMVRFFCYLAAFKEFVFIINILYRSSLGDALDLLLLLLVLIKSGRFADEDAVDRVDDAEEEPFELVGLVLGCCWFTCGLLTFIFVVYLNKILEI